MSELNERRPLKVRNVQLAKKIAVWLSNKDITPNAISISSVVFAFFAAVCFMFMSATNYTWLPILAALFIQLRLLCNLFDGMVAVEGGKGTRSGELYNDIPDRIADPLIIIAVGYSIPMFSWADTLGWLVGLLAVMTAYIRTLVSSMGAPVDFSGPMAKQHRMALITFACILTPFETMLWPQGYVFLSALIVMLIGVVVTIWRRIRAAYYFLENN